MRILIMVGSTRPVRVGDRIAAAIAGQADELHSLVAVAA